MKHQGIHRHTAALALVSLCACTGLKDSGDRCAGPFSPIHQVQGPGTAGPMAGERVTVRGVVVGDFQRPDQLDGFFVQEPRADDDPRTSEGIFVRAPGAAEVSAGDLIQVSGEVGESSGLTELSEVEEIAVCRPGETPEPTPISLTEVDDLEPYEGMLVAVSGGKTSGGKTSGGKTFGELTSGELTSGELTVAGSYRLARYGQLLLAAGGRPFRRTNVPSASLRESEAPGTARGRRLLLDDGSRVENPPAPPYLDEDGTRRTGDTVSGLIGVISETRGGHVLHPTTAARFTGANPRAAAPPPVGGTLRVASFNLLNYFTTLGERGASNPAELERQRAKHVAAISGLDADVVGLNELENNGEGAIRDLVDALNAAGSDPSEGEQTKHTWAYVGDPPSGFGDDGIRVGLIYRPAAVRPVGPPAIDRDPVFKRPPFAQTFEARGERFTVVVNHFKSKSCREAEGPEKDVGDGQGCWNLRRTRQARRLLEFVARLQADSGDADVLVIGDLNAYGAEDPVRALTDGGLIDQVAAHVGAAGRYSYVYYGEAGYLDHALATPSLAGRVTAAAFWHINADEPTFLGYKSPFAPHRPDLFRPDAYRSSDHDPVLIGLAF